MCTPWNFGSTMILEEKKDPYTLNFPPMCSFCWKYNSAKIKKGEIWKTGWLQSANFDQKNHYFFSSEISVIPKIGCKMKFCFLPYFLESNCQLKIEVMVVFFLVGVCSGFFPFIWLMSSNSQTLTGSTMTWALNLFSKLEILKSKCFSFSLTSLSFQTVKEEMIWQFH